MLGQRRLGRSCKRNPHRCAGGANPTTRRQFHHASLGQCVVVVCRALSLLTELPLRASPQVEEVFGRYCAELLRVFDENKDACLPPEVAARGLTIVRRETPASASKAAAVGGAKL